MLEVKNLWIEFGKKDEVVRAVDEISFKIEENEVVGLVGESGSGKSVTALSIMGLLPNLGKIRAGEIFWQGKNLRKLNGNSLRKIRGAEIGLIFQNPQASLNPVFTIGNQMIETIRVHKKISKNEAKLEAIRILKKVNIPDAEIRINHYPHQFSIGMCQRIMIAMTLLMKPRLLIADEPTASLDVTIQAQILELLDEVRTEFNMSVLLISHDLGVIAQRCDYVLIMYLGKILEQGPAKDIFMNPLHPYTKALIEAIPKPDPNLKQKIAVLKGDIPSPMNIPKGCRFSTRCAKAFDKCFEEQPKFVQKGKSQVACFLYY